MAAPNLVNTTSIIAKSAGGGVSNTIGTILQNLTGSNKLLKVNSITIANTTSNNTCHVSISMAAGNTTPLFYLCKTVPIEQDNTLVVISKDYPIYMEENTNILAIAQFSADLTYSIGYEEIDDA